MAVKELYMRTVIGFSASAINACAINIFLDFFVFGQDKKIVISTSNTSS